MPTTAPADIRVRVACADDGSPRRLIWGHRRLRVIGRPVQWFGRRPWWKTARRAEPGTAGDLIERPMWQVQAQDVETGEILTLDLAREDAGWEVADEHQ